MLPNPNTSYGTHDWTCLGYKNKAAPLIRHGFMGIINDFRISGKWFADITQATHGDIPYTTLCTRFRYLPYYKKGTIVWTDSLDMTHDNIRLVMNFIRSEDWPLEGRVDGQVQIIESLINEKYGTVPIYNEGDVPNIPKRT